MANEGLGYEALARIQTECHVMFPTDRNGFIVATADGPVTVINGADRWEIEL